MHPGPINRGVEITSDVADSKHAIILDQVEKWRSYAHGGYVFISRTAKWLTPLFHFLKSEYQLIEPILKLFLFIVYLRYTFETWLSIKKAYFQKTRCCLVTLLAHLDIPRGIAILKTLAEKQECICGEIVEVLPLAQSTVSQHLKELKKIGLIQGTLNGPKSCYCINWDAFEKYTQAFQALTTSLIQLKPTQTCC